MWGLFRQEELGKSDVPPHSESPVQSKKGGSQKKGVSGKQRLGFGRHKAHQQNSKKAGEADEPSEILNISVSDEAMNVAETNSGIEVSLDWKAAATALLKKTDESSKTDAEAAGPAVPAVSPSHRLRQCKRVHRSQFSVTYPALERLSTAVHDSSSKSLRRNHRVPILDIRPEFMCSQKQMVALLESYETRDESSAVQDEVNRLRAELEAIEDDRIELDQTFLRIPAAPEERSGEMGPPNWDINYLLGAREDLTQEERAHLQQNRGLCLTFHMQNPRAKEALLSKCGSKAGLSKVKEKFGASLTLGPNNCRRGGAAASIRHMAVMGGADTTSSFFTSLDSGKSFAWGPLPTRLYRRMAQEGITPQNGGGLLYLSTGPRGCYYCQFQTGECWWGSSFEDDHEFESIVNDWDVYRVAFGPIVTYDDENGGTTTANSWIILGYDGRVAWKNLPCRLHNRLYGRLADWAAPVEVALGSGGSYFVRFLDGTMDYCLPAAIAGVCEHIEQNGGIITDMVLHPDASHDYVIRHTEVAS